LRPLFRFTWPSISGAIPPVDVLRHFARYDAVALAMRLRSRYLQARAFGVNAGGLDAYVQKHVIADTDCMHRWMSAGTGVIYACPHYGPFLLGALLVATQGSNASPSHVFYDPAESVPDNHRFDKFFQQFGDRLSVLHDEPRDLVRALRALKNKQCLSIMFVPFFDRLYPAMGGAAYLSLQSGAPIIPAYVVPDRGCKARGVRTADRARQFHECGSRQKHLRHDQNAVRRFSEAARPRTMALDLLGQCWGGFPLRP
jgi:hypothetical protein